MALLQFPLLFVGNVCLWGCLGGYVPSLMVAWLFRVDPGLLFFLGTGLGIILGVVHTFLSVSHQGLSTWQLPTWLGIVLGVALYYLIRPFTFATFISWWWVGFMPVAAAGMLGGLAGTYFGPMLWAKLTEKKPRKKGKRVRAPLQWNKP